MSSTLAKPTDVAESASAHQFDSFFVRQLQKAGSHIKLIDLVTGLALVAVVTLGALLLVCLVDAWVVTLPVWFRLAVLVGLVGYAVFVFAWHVVPLFMWRINPAYAARMIEHGSPGLKNSLLNYLFLRSMPAQQRNAVYGAVRQRAAQDLSAIAIESSVDRGRLIRIGFALVGVVLAAGLYKLLSPKDPVQTLRRVLAPLADVQAPSRVRVTRVEPGSVDLYFGESLEVRAEIRGASSATHPVLVFTTDDGQFVDATVPLSPTDRRHEFSGLLAPTAGGIRQSLTYWVAAGDGRSSDYRVRVRPAPTIAVSSVELEPPDYTELPPVRSEGIGDVEGVEGTRVRLTALANLPIASAYIEFVKARTRGPGEPVEYQSIETLSMQPSGDQAHGEFQLPRLGGEAPYTHYRLKFTTPQGYSNQDSSAYVIKIRPDIAPELTVEKPAQQELSVPLDANLEIAARAADPDFKLASIWLFVAHKGKIPLQQNLTLDPPSGIGSVQANYRLRPDALGLKVGDEAVMYLIAKDNRHSLSGELDANQTRSQNYTLRIVAPCNDGSASDRNDANPGDGNSQKSNPGANEPNPNPGENSPKSGDQSQSGNSDDKQTGEDQNAEGDAASGSKSSPKNPDEKNSGDSNQSSSGNMASGGGGDADQQAKPGEQGGGEQGNSSSNAQPASDNSQASGTQPGGNSSQAASDANPNGGSQPQNREPASSNDSQAAAAGENDASASGEGELADDAPLNDFSSDGQRMDRLLQRAKDQTQQPDRNEVKSEGSHDQASGEPSSNRPAGDRTPDEANDRRSNPDPNGNNENNGSNNGSNANARSDQHGAQGQSDRQPANDGERSENSTGDGQGNQNRSQLSEAGGNDSSANRPADNNDGNNSKPESQGDSAGNKKPSESNPLRNQGENDGSGAEDQRGDEGQPADPSQPETADDGKQHGDPAGQSSGDNQGDQSQAASGERPDAAQAQNKQPDESQQPSGDDPANSSETGNPESAQPIADPRTQSQPPENEGDSAGDPSEAQASDQAAQAEPNSGENPGSRSADNARATPSTQRNARGEKSSAPERSGPQGDFNPTTDDPTERENLEASREATELVLGYLRDQQHDPDPSLLNEMNWTETEMREFLRRWETMRSAAESGDRESVEKYEESLRSLGLKSQRAEARRTEMRTDRIDNLNEDSAVSRPPGSREEAYRQFLRRRSHVDNQ